MNKPIIIDGVDVAKCKHFDDSDCLNPALTVLSCEAETNCLYKQLQRLKAENERLSELTCVNCGEKFLSPTGSELYEENVRLKSENERLKAPSMIIPQVGKLGVPIEQYCKLKQALEEVREIVKLECKDLCNYCDWLNTDSCEPDEYTCGTFKKIQHKINEVLK